MLKIRIDYSTIAFDNINGGIGRYIIEMSKALRQYSGIELQGACKISRITKKYKIRKHLPNVPVYNYPSFSSNPHIFHGPDFEMDYYGKAKKVVTIHDLATFYPELVDTKRVENSQKGDIQKIVKRKDIDAIFTVSEFTKNEILKFFPNCEKRIFVTPLAAHLQQLNVAYLQEQKIKPYFLFVGTLDKRKNILGLCKAFEMIASNFKEIDLMIVGGHNGFESVKVLEFIENSFFKDRFILKHQVNEQELVFYYKNAFAFLFPSFYEGFGIPVLEAMQYHLPIITSQKSVMQEVAAAAALYIDAWDVYSIAQGLTKILNDESLRNELIQATKQRKLFFSWEKTSKKTIEAYQAIHSDSF
jgi:O-antigen biosynthesis alpha-1,3-mannosyltransferase